MVCLNRAKTWKILKSLWLNTKNRVDRPSVSVQKKNSSRSATSKSGSSADSCFKLEDSSDSKDVSASRSHLARPKTDHGPGPRLERESPGQLELPLSEDRRIDLAQAWLNYRP